MTDTASPLKTQINDAMKAAMRAREKERLATIRLMQAEFKRIEVDERIELDDQRVLAVLDKMVKQRRDAAKQYEDANRQELADQEMAEVAVIQEFMPKALTEDEIQSLIVDAINQTQAQNMQDMGKVMGILKPALQGRADMGAVSKWVRQQLG